MTFPELPQEPNQEIGAFIKTFKHLLSENQIYLLELFRDKIYGVYLKEHTLEKRKSMNLFVDTNEVIFSFEHKGVKGEVKFYF